MLKLAYLNQYVFARLFIYRIQEKLENVRYPEFIEVISSMKSVVRIQMKDFLDDSLNSSFRVEDHDIAFIKLEEIKATNLKELRSKEYPIEVIRKNISFEVKPKEKVVLVAPSGFGKSLLLSAIGNAGGNCSKGRYYFGEKEVPKNLMNLYTYRVPSKIEFLSLSLRENLNLKNKISDDEILELLKTYNFNINSVDLDKIYTENSYSDGQKKRLGLVRMECELKDRPNCLLLLDEVFSNLDENTLEKAVSRLEKLPNSAIIVSHEKKVQERFRTINLSKNS